MKLRKHIRADILRKMHESRLLGVPVAKLMQQHLPEGSITRPTVFHLLVAFDDADSLEGIAWEDHEKLMDSVVPPWLDPMGEAVQVQPEDYNYEGRFPDGRWVCRT